MILGLYCRDSCFNVIEWRLRGLGLHKHKYAGQLPWGYERTRSNKRGNVCTMQHLGAFVQLLLL
jgi:hypothetical protein